MITPLLLATAALAPPPAGSTSPAQLSALASTAGTSLVVRAELTGATGQAFALYAYELGEDFDSRTAVALTAGPLDTEGNGLAELVLPTPGDMPDDLTLVLQAFYMDGTTVTASEGAVLPFSGVAPCELLDFDFTLGPDEPVKGQVIDTEWADMGMQVSAQNNFPGGPDLAIIFDSGMVSGGDDDLATPGTGSGNDEALGNLLIIAENDFDFDFDGLVDNPDDSAWGGTIRLDFDDPVTICSMTLVDIDDAMPTELRFSVVGQVLPQVIAVPNQGDNSVQELDFLMTDVTRLDVVFGGSGGIADMELQPCPQILNFDETSTGIPADFKTGEEINTQLFATLGITISASNNFTGHPDKAILFDTENPTGGDFDLMTPGPGLGNDTPLGKVLIIAENDVDADMDGLVDDPDDEAFGGTIAFTFSTDVAFKGISLLDVDGTEVDFVILVDSNGLVIASEMILNLGDNSVQSFVAITPIPNVREIIVNLGGSGGISRLRWCPDPSSTPTIP